jgi:hypothetical protein
MRIYNDIYKKYYIFIISNKKLKLLVKSTMNKFDFSDYLNKKYNNLDNYSTYLSNYESINDFLFELFVSSYENKSLIFSGGLCAYLDDFRCEISYNDGTEIINYEKHYDNIISTNINDIRKLKFKNIC